MARADLDNVRKAAAAVHRAELALGEAMRRARASGETLRDIGDAAGLKHQRVARILDAADERHRGRAHNTQPQS